MSVTTEPTESAPPDMPEALAAQVDASVDTGVETKNHKSHLLPWIIAGVAVIVAVVTTMLWLPLQQVDADRNDVAAAGLDFLDVLTNWDAGDDLAPTVDAVQGYATGGFATEAGELFGGDLGQALTAAGASSVGTVERLYVQELNGDEAEIFAIVEQQLSNDVTTDVDVVLRGVVMSLTRVDGNWLVSALQLLPDLPAETVPADDGEA